MTKFLIVDDNEQDLIMMKALLEGHGYEVRMAVNGAEALKLARLDGPPDIIISDIMMPVMDGFTLCCECKQDNILKEIPFIFYSAMYTDKKDEDLAIKAGADEFILKPQEPDEFVTIIQNVMRQFEQNKLETRKPLINAGSEIFKLYSDQLVIKLENKMLELEQEITERKKAEAELRESENKYHTLFESANDAIFIMKDDLFIDCNRKTLEMFGCTREQIINQSPYRFSPPVQPDGTESREKALVGIEAAYAGRPQFFEWRHQKYDGTLFDTEVSLNAISLGSKRYLLAIVREITERKKLESQLFHAQKMESIGTLAGGIAHDFNNVLTAIIGFANLIKMKIKEDSSVIENVDYIISSANKAAYLTQSLLSFSRKQVINPKPIKINEVIQYLKRFLNRILGEDIELNVVLSDKNPTIMADSVQMDQVLMNLATNARDAMPDGGKLSIMTESVTLDSEFIKVYGYGEEGDYTLISVADTGIGMDEATMNKIFEPFFTTKEVGAGTGLGMSVLYGIIKQHNGHINVYSKPGEGTIFKIYFPIIVRDVAQPAEADEMLTLKKGTETILVAEDNEMVRELTTTVLEQFGYTVIQTINGVDAIEEFMKNRDSVQLLILDVIMPKKNGKVVFEEIKKIRPDIKAIFTSGYPKDIIHKEGILDGEFNFIQKPPTPQDLLEKVREVLDQ